jgi:SH3 domain-containing YSC84-like protein 1
MKKALSVLILATLVVSVASVARAEKDNDRAKELERVQAAGRVLDEIMNTPDKGIPAEVLKSAKCVAVVPSMLKGGFILGARYGKGLATCRTGNGWSAPAPIRVEGGSYGLQIGGEAVDLVMLVMNEQGMNHLLSSKFKIGADASAAAGPVGRDVQAATNVTLKSEILTYSRARGAFAGITLNGAVVKQDEDDIRALYGKQLDFRALLTGRVPPPQETQSFLASVRRNFREARDVASDRRSRSETERTTASGAAGTTGTATSTERKSRADESGAIAGSAGAKGSKGGVATEDNADVRSDVEKALRNEPGLSSSTIVVTVRPDAIELSGSVPTQNDKAAARRVAESKAGDRKVVDDKLVVK